MTVSRAQPHSDLRFPLCLVVFLLSCHYSLVPLLPITLQTRQPQRGQPDGPHHLAATLLGLTLIATAVDMQEGGHGILLKLHLEPGGHEDEEDLS